MVTAGKRYSPVLSLDYSHFNYSACAKRSLPLQYMVTILKLCMISGTHRSRSFSPNPELFLGQRLSRREPGVTAARGPTTISESADACQPESLGCHFPGARETRTGPELTPTRVGEEGGAAALGAGAGRERDRGMLAAAASPASGCRAGGAPGGGVGVRRAAARGLKGRQKRPRILTQPGLQTLPFRLRHIAASRAGPAASNLATTC